MKKLSQHGYGHYCGCCRCCGCCVLLWLLLWLLFTNNFGLSIEIRDFLAIRCSERPRATDCKDASGTLRRRRWQSQNGYGWASAREALPRKTNCTSFRHETTASAAAPRSPDFNFSTTAAARGAFKYSRAGSRHEQIGHLQGLGSNRLQSSSRRAGTRSKWLGHCQDARTMSNRWWGIMWRAVRGPCSKPDFNVFELIQIQLI